MREITVKIYQYDELDEKAKEKALNWFEKVTMNDDWYQRVEEDAKSVGIKITGFDTYYPHISGEIISSTLEVIENIMVNHGKDCETYKTAKSYEPAFRNLEEVRDDDNEKFNDEYEKAEKEFLNAVLKDYLVLLRHEAERVQSREYLEEGLRANEYEFTVDGKSA